MFGDEKRLRFNKCVINSLDGFIYSTFAGWAGELHCKEVTGDELYRLKRYLVNYFLCPDATTEEELMACYYEVWPPDDIEDVIPALPDPQSWLNWHIAALVITATLAVVVWWAIWASSR
jgi:hypothetical protein